MSQVQLPERWLLVLWDVDHTLIENHGVNTETYARAFERASAKYGVSFGPATTVLVGDTPRDVWAGLDGGAHVVAVASGSDDMDTLREAGPDVVLSDLRDTRAVVRAVTQFRGQTARDVPPI